MTLIDKAEALATLRKHANGKTVLGGQVYQSLTLETALEAIAALPARGVGVTWHPFDTAPRDGSRFLAQGGGLDAVDICSYNARVGCWDCGAVTLDDTDQEPEGYNRPAQWMPLAALAPTDAAQAREAEPEMCGKCMGSGYGRHPDSGVLCPDCNGTGGISPAPDAREAARREAAFLGVCDCGMTGPCMWDQCKHPLINEART